MNNALIITGVAIVSAAAGAAGGYIYAKRSLTAHYTKTFDSALTKEVKKVKDSYAKLHKAEEYETPQKAAEALGVEVPESVQVETKQQNAASLILGYQGASEFEQDQEEKKQKIQNIFDKYNEDNEWDLNKELRLREDSYVYIIHQDEYQQNETDYTQTHYTYFEGDDTLVDDRDQPIIDVEGMVGEDNLSRLGHGSEDPNIVFIRNEKMELDIEVVRSRGSYTREVLGIVDEPIPLRNRRFRDTDE